MSINKIISIIAGILFGILIYFIMDRSTVYHGPNSNVIRKKIYKKNGKCYMLTPILHLCV